MAIFNEILAGRYNRALQKLFAIKGPPPVRQLAGEISPNISVFSGVENRYLESWLRFAVVLTLGPTVAQIEAGQLRNPSGSNVIAVLEAAFFATGANPLQVSVSMNHLNQADLTNVSTGILLDPRAGPPGQKASVCIPSTSAGGAVDLAFTIARAVSPANTTYPLILEDDQEITLLPGDTYRFLENTVNNQMFVNLIWRERFLEESERT